MTSAPEPHGAAGDGGGPAAPLRTTWRTELPPLAVVAATALASAVAWPRAPGRMPMHWNIQGQVDRWGGKLEGLLLLPVVALGMYLLLTFLPRLDPGRTNYARFGGAYRLIRLAVLSFLAFVHAVVLGPAFGYRVEVARAVPAATGLLFVLLGATMGKIRPNWFVGIRTPWTLSSKRSWVRTHRLGGWLFIASGVAILTASLVFSGAVVIGIVLGSCVLGSTLVSVVYSYLVWRDDPDRLSPSGTEPAEPER